MKNDILEVETIFVFDDRIRLCFKIKVILVCSFIPFVCVQHALAKDTPSQKCTLGDEEKYYFQIHGRDGNHIVPCQPGPFIFVFIVLRTVLMSVHLLIVFACGLFINVSCF